MSLSARIRRAVRSTKRRADLVYDGVQLTAGMAGAFYEGWRDGQETFDLGIVERFIAGNDALDGLRASAFRVRAEGTRLRIAQAWWEGRAAYRYGCASECVPDEPNRTVH